VETGRRATERAVRASNRYGDREGLTRLSSLDSEPNTMDARVDFAAYGGWPPMMTRCNRNML